MPEAFHFLQPLWLLALLPLLALAAWAVRGGAGDSPWRRTVDARLLPLLMAGRPAVSNRSLLTLLAAGWVIAALALAGPTWQRRPQPVFQTDATRVVVLDLSRTMNAADLPPTRLARARYKVEDVLAEAGEGQTALVVYAGDAFTVAPLTRDANTVRALLQVLEPDLMPVPGRRADLGLRQAGELMRHAGVTRGQVLLIADGIDPGHVGDTEGAAQRLRQDGYRVSVLGVGTEAGAPLTDDQGHALRDSAGQPRITRLDPASLQAVARSGGGRYLPVSDSGAALHSLLDDGSVARVERDGGTSAATASTWRDQGPWLVLLLLPLAALAFRRNWLLGLVLVAGLASPPEPAMASPWTDAWASAWKRPDQRAAAAMAAGDYGRAARVATDPEQRGSAEYRRGDYAGALAEFSRASGARADYNRGNALARLGRYADAVAAYDQALEADPGDADAKTNKAAVEARLEQQHSAKQQNGQPPGAPSQASAARDGTSNARHGQDGAQASAQGSSQPKPAQQDHAGGSSAGGSHAAASPDPQSAAARPGQAGAQDPASRSAGSKPGSDFAEAVRKLAAQGGKPAADQGASQATGPRGPATARADATAKSGPMGAADGAQAITSEEQLAAEQWLRRIPDDPGGLLRRKFLYQYRQRAMAAGAGPSGAP